MREASQTEIVKLAERQAGDIIDDARRQARETRLEMEDWADSILSTLEVNLDKFLIAVKRGRERLHERSQETVVAGVTGGGGVTSRARTTTTRTRAAVDTYLAVASKRDWRSYADRPVPAGGRAADPRRAAGSRGSAQNRQPWLFVVVESAGGEGAGRDRPSTRRTTSQRRGWWSRSRRQAAAHRSTSAVPCRTCS